jgi:hypothetical protein
MPKWIQSMQQGSYENHHYFFRRRRFTKSVIKHFFMKFHCITTHKCSIYRAMTGLGQASNGALKPGTELEMSESLAEEFEQHEDSGETSNYS